MSRKTISRLIYASLLLAVMIASLHAPDRIAETVVPIFFLLAMLIGLALISLATHRQRRNAFRIRHGLCTHCGYDLRASPNRCPECGAYCALPSSDL